MRAEIIAVGSELLSPYRQDTNSLFLTGQLNSLGIEVSRKCVVSDHQSEIADALSQSLQKSEIVLSTGGLGPTNDDLTRESVAHLLGLELRENAGVLEDLKRRYSRFGLRVTANNRKQAAVPAGAEVIPNPHGTAPGLLIRHGQKLVFLLPGPPRELIPMVKNHVVPIIRESKPTRNIYSRQLKVGSEAESRVDARIESSYKRYAEIDTTILSSPGIITLNFVWRGTQDRNRAEAELDRLVAEVREELGEAIFTASDESLAQVLGRLLVRNKATLAVAESCTGGLIGKLLTDVPGSSDYMAGGVIAYSNAAKMELLGVDSRAIEQNGAVSSKVAEQMADGVRRRLKSSIGLSVTGIAGPGGGTDEKPVGTIFLGLATAKQRLSRGLLLPGTRETIRMRTSNMALDWVRRELL